MSVVSLPGKGPLVSPEGMAPVGDIIDALEKALNEAKAGRIRAVGLAIVLCNGDTSTRFACDSDEAVSRYLMAAATYLQVRYANHRLGISDAHSA